MKRVIFLIIIFAFSVVTTSYANDDKSYVENLIKNTTSKVLSILKNKKLTEKEKKKEIFKIVNPLFDFNIMAKLTLGKKYWKKLSPEQQKRFIELFTKRIKMVYFDRITLKEVTVKFKPAVQKNKRVIFIPTIFTSEGKDYSINFKLWKSKKGWKIYDVEIEGVSIIRTYRSQFHGVLSKGTVKDLFEKLEILNKENKKK